MQVGTPLSYTPYPVTHHRRYVIGIKVTSRRGLTII
jgi:hypothetical protein